MRRAPAVAIACCLALGACGSDTLDDEKGEKLISAEIEKVTGVSGVKVTCPDDREAKKGDVFNCEAVGADGTKQAVEVRQKDDEGNVHFESPVLHTGEAETAMLPVVAGTKKGVKVDCPDLVIPVKDKTMKCEASATDGSHADVTVRFTGQGGRFNVVDVKER
jgi:hypothetical protein